MDLVLTRGRVRTLADVICTRPSTLYQLTYLLDALQFRAESLYVAGAVVEQNGVAGHGVVRGLVEKFTIIMPFASSPLKSTFDSN